ncbi:unnamed protein product [Durusdinium trenchii]|uniref:RNA-editing substrate-binding complex 6 protein domain-containing protein n=1 Tax=Durusdinium trenchii TaxID=1381693 RepID=A0ABP0Q545_9DINO
MRRLVSVRNRVPHFGSESLRWPRRAVTATAAPSPMHQEPATLMEPRGAVAESLGAADLIKVPEMSSSRLRKISQAAAAEGASLDLWNAVAKRCEETADSLNYWDAVHILQSFTEASVANESLLLCLAEALSAKTSKMATKHVLDLLAVYEAADLRPRALYVELLHSIVRLSRSMYAEEVALTLQALARYNIGNPTVIAQLMRTVASEIKEFRLRYLCATTGALGVLRACPPELLKMLNQRARFEVDTINVQELLDNIQAFPQLEYSWQPYEDLCLEEFMARVAKFRTAEDVDQLVDPFEGLLFLHSRNKLDAGYLRALCQWLLKGVHRPNVRSERRPTSKQLVMLYDFCFEHGIEEEPALQDTLAYFIESGGGIWPERYAEPLRYKKKRKYIRTDDPLKDVELPPLDEDGVVVAEEVKTSRAESIYGEESPRVVASHGKKPSGPSPLLEDPEDTLVYRIKARSRKGIRPRNRDPLRKRDFNKQTVPGPMHQCCNPGLLLVDVSVEPDVALSKLKRS